MKKFYFILFITLSAALSACNFTQKDNSKVTSTNTSDTIPTSEQPTNLSDLKNDYLKRKSQFKSEHQSEQSVNLSDLQSCTVDHISFSVDKNWKPIEGHKGSFVTSDKTSVYQLQGISPLGNTTPDEFYKGLKKSYTNSYKILHSDDTLHSFITADDLDAMIGNIEMTADHVLYSIDVLIVPQKNIVVTFAAQCPETENLPLDIRTISETATFHIATKDSISGNTFIAEDDSEICFKADKSFIYYQSADDHNGAYYDGTYEVYYGQSAIDKVCSMTEYGITEDELEQTIAANMNGYTLKGDLSYLDNLDDDFDDNSNDDFGDNLDEDTEKEKKDTGYHVCKDTFYAVILHNEKLVDADGQITKMGHDTLYIGHYVPDLKLADMVNANTANYIKWSLKEKTK